MKAYVRKAATLGSTFALAVSGLVLSTTPASAATSCYASSCEGLDPSTTVCQNDAKTVATTDYPGVELRYSPTCRAAWARYSRGAAFSMNVTVERWNGSTGTERYRTYYSGNGAGVWTRMVNDAGLQARACGRESDGWGCSGAY
ncbi:DUF2690 domain-containing protein [Streptomyces sp. NBC_00691]|uniref:DUF2690 domain-containing protein n=1 Tax=Streptomyces sp. NBC_00691 TaxID=2903671 RepID=UPI002E36C6D9|nr:DUF2690 domain-containing protein [Streptomyces sp. NBC_00691]